MDTKNNRKKLTLSVIPVTSNSGITKSTKEVLNENKTFVQQFMQYYYSTDNHPTPKHINTYLIQNNLETKFIS